MFRQEPPFLEKLKRKISVCVLRLSGSFLQMVLYCVLLVLSVMMFKIDHSGSAPLPACFQLGLTPVLLRD